jgi:hypothetical protein
VSTRHPYASDAYAAAFGAPHRPFRLPEWQTNLLLRPIGGTGREDAASCYPRTIMAPGASLADGLRRLRDAGAVSVVLVLDPLSLPSSPSLMSDFHLARPFKRHFVIDRRKGAPSFSSHHRYEIRRAERRCAVREIALADHLPEWTSLYRALVERHGITGIQRFSEGCFEALARLPGLIAYAAFVDRRIVGMSLWLRHGERACSHLAATNDEGYRVGASYLLYATAIDGLRDCRWLDLGGTPGAEDDASSGLARLKGGFANATAEAWLCGHVLDDKAYASLSRDLPATGFFPAYRQPLAFGDTRSAGTSLREPALPE